MSELERLVGKYHDLLDLGYEEARYARLEALSRIYVELVDLAAKDGFGSDAVTWYAEIVARNP